jgi:hypothetical protein
MGRYEDFSRVTASSPRVGVRLLGLEPADAQRRALVGEYRRLATFPEVPAVLESLAAGSLWRSCRTGIPTC